MWHRVVSLSRGATTPKEEKASYEIKTKQNYAGLHEQCARCRCRLRSERSNHTARWNSIRLHYSIRPIGLYDWTGIMASWHDARTIHSGEQTHGRSIKLRSYSGRLLTDLLLFGATHQLSSAPRFHRIYRAVCCERYAESAA